jgi:hypothetical protein
MKRVIVILSILVLSVPAKSQKQELQHQDKSIFGVQAGFLGAWIYGEYEVLNKVAIRGEMGIDIGAWGSFYDDRSFLFSSPVFTLEPRWYSKANRDKGFFLALKTSYTFDWFEVGSRKEKMGAFLCIPSIGIRRALGKHFDYEIGAGWGFQRRYTKDLGYDHNLDGSVPNVRLRIGYHF